MSGVEVHTEDPINTRTSPPRTTSSATAPASVLATATSSAAPPNPTAQPGSRAPAPTPSSGYVYTSPPAVPTATQSYVPTASRTTGSGGPAPPQPGALPTPSDLHASRRSASPIPPPPKAGEKLQPAEFYAPQPAVGPTAAASYGTLDQPVRGVPPAGVTGAIPPSAGVGAGIGSARGDGQPRRSIEHPPGYRQDPYASDRVPNQYGGYAPPNDSSMGLGSEERKENSILSGISDTLVGLTGSGGGASSGSSILGGGRSLDGDESIMNTVGSWAKSVGKKAAELESEVWKKVNGEK